MINYLFLFLVLISSSAAFAEDVNFDDLSPKELVLKAVEHWRGAYSYTESEMTIHRANYEKSLGLKAWTRGRTSSLVRFVKPAKDSGNATLMKGDDVWTFSPRTNRTIRIPPSMKAQSWMGSDFSYQDLAKDDDIIDHYNHTFSGSKDSNGQKVKTVTSIPKDDAPIVWGREELDIRDDLIIVEHRYFDQEGKLIKYLIATKVEILGDRLYPVKARMTNEETKEWTEITNTVGDFLSVVPETIFTSTNLESSKD